MQRAISSHVLVNQRLNTVWLRRIRDAGIPAVELFCARQHLDYRNREQVNELAYWFRDSDLALHSLHSPMYNDDCWGRTGPSAVVTLTEVSKPRRLDCLDEIKRALEIAEQIPCRYLIQHLGVKGEEFDERKLDAAFTALEDLVLFARHRGVEVLLENIPNALSSAERLRYFLEITHLDLNFCFDTGHAQLTGNLAGEFGRMKERIRSTHVHDNNGVDDVHLFPLLAPGGSIDWSAAMPMLRQISTQTPLLLELKESPEFPQPLAAAQTIFDRLEAL